MMKRIRHGVTPREVVDVLTVYKEAVMIPIHYFHVVAKELERDKTHNFIISVKNDMLYIELIQDRFENVSI